MRITKDKLKDKIINRISSMSRDRLKNIDEYIDQLEQKNKKKQEILSFAGSWKDIDEEVFNDFTDHLHANRTLGNDRIK
jgi:hypothetical protein